MHILFFFSKKIKTKLAFLPLTERICASFTYISFKYNKCNHGKRIRHTACNGQTTWQRLWRRNVLLCSKTEKLEGKKTRTYKLYVWLMLLWCWWWGQPTITPLTVCPFFHREASHTSLVVRVRCRFSTETKCLLGWSVCIVWDNLCASSSENTQAQASRQIAIFSLSQQQKNSGSEVCVLIFWAEMIPRTHLHNALAHANIKQNNSSVTCNECTTTAYTLRNM